MTESSPNGWKTLKEMEKLLVTSNFSFPHGVFNRLVPQTRKTQGLFGKRLNKPTLSKSGCIDLQKFSRDKIYFES